MRRLVRIVLAVVAAVAATGAVHAQWTPGQWLDKLEARTAKRLIAVSSEGLPLTVDRLSPRITRATQKESNQPMSLAEQEKELIELHLKLSGGNRTHTAQSLGISREGLRKKMKRLGLS